MSDYGKSSANVNKTIILETIDSDADGIFTGCTAIVTNMVQSCTGNTSITMGTDLISTTDPVQVNSLSATTIFSGGTNLIDIINDGDTYLSGSTLSGSTLILTRNDGFNIIQDLSSVNSGDTFVTTANYSSSADTITLTRNDDVDIEITGVTDTFVTGGTLTGNAILVLDRNDSLSAITVDLSPLLDDTNSFVTGSTFNNDTLTLTLNNGDTVETTINSFNTLNVSGDTSIGGTLTADTVNANTILSGGTNILDIVNANDTFVTGGTLVDKTLVLDRNDSLSAITVDLSGLTTNADNGLTLTSGGTIELGGTLKNNRTYFLNEDASFKLVRWGDADGLGNFNHIGRIDEVTSVGRMHLDATLPSQSARFAYTSRSVSNVIYAKQAGNVDMDFNPGSTFSGITHSYGESTASFMRTIHLTDDDGIGSTVHSQSNGSHQFNVTDANNYSGSISIGAGLTQIFSQDVNGIAGYSFSPNLMLLANKDFAGIIASGANVSIQSDFNNIFMMNDPTNNDNELRDGTINKRGIRYVGFGEVDVSGTSANYDTLVGTSLVPLKLLEDKINDITLSGENAITITTGNTIQLGGELNKDTEILGSGTYNLTLGTLADRIDVLSGVTTSTRLKNTINGTDGTFIEGDIGTLDLKVELGGTQVGRHFINGPTSLEQYTASGHGVVINRDPGRNDVRLTNTQYDTRHLHSFTTQQLLISDTINNREGEIILNAGQAYMRSVDALGSAFLNVEASNTYFENTWFRLTLAQQNGHSQFIDSSNTKKGLILRGFGESDVTDSLETASWSGLSRTSLITKGYVDDNEVTVTGVTFNNNSLTINSSDDSSVSAEINNFTGLTVNGDTLITGDLTIIGSATTINSEQVLIKDNIITLNSNVTGTTEPVLDAGFEVFRGSGDTKQFLWKEDTDNWSLDDSLFVNGSVSGTTYYGDGSNLTGINTDNFANADLTLSANRTHDLNGNTVTFTGTEGSAKIQSDGRRMLMNADTGTIAATYQLSINNGFTGGMLLAGTGARADLANKMFIQSPYDHGPLMLLNTAASDNAELWFNISNGSSSDGLTTKRRMLITKDDVTVHNAGLIVDPDNTGTPTKLLNEKISLKGSTTISDELVINAPTTQIVDGNLIKNSMSFHIDGGELKGRYKDNLGVVTDLTIGSSDNIYTTDGTLTSERTVDLDGNNLQFSDGLSTRWLFQSNGRLVSGDNRIQLNMGNAGTYSTDNYLKGKTAILGDGNDSYIFSVGRSNSASAFTVFESGKVITLYNFTQFLSTSEPINGDLLINNTGQLWMNNGIPTLKHKDGSGSFSNIPLLSDDNRYETTAVTGTTVVESFNTGTTEAVTWHYSINDGSNLRAGTVVAGWLGSNVVYTETSTTDIGDTSAVTLDVNENGGDIRLVATPTSGTWTIKVKRILI